MQSVAVTVALLVGLALTGRAQGRVIRGVVRDTADQPLLGVSVRVPNGPAVASNDSGRFRLELSTRGKVSFDLHRIGFMPSRFSLGDGGDTTLIIILFPSPQTLPKVAIQESVIGVNLRRGGFAERLEQRRRGTNSGFFVTPEEIELRKPRDVTDLFRTFPGVNVRTTSSDQAFLYGTGLLVDPRSSPGHSVMVRCAISIYIDGQRMNNLGDGGVTAPDINRIVTPEAIAGIEYYPSANRAPQQYQSLNGGCGVALIWTKSGGSEQH